MTTITMTTPSRTRSRASATGLRAPAAVRFLGHFAAALVGVAFLGRDLEH